MGYDLPAAIGAWYGALADRGKQQRIICFAGDGSLQMNIQELQTLVNYNIPIKLFVLNNAGYLSIRSSQQNFFGRLNGAGPESGVTLPSFAQIGAAYGIESLTLNCENFLPEIRRIIATAGPALCEVILDEKQGFEPRMSSRQLENGQIITPPLEDMFPFLDREELKMNMDNLNYE
jgi:acetolactate synthase I/II/III large subunit